MDALEMGNYGFYVWSSFALTFLVVVISDWRAREYHKQIYHDIEVRLKAHGDAK
jgi:heme exporter protein CcmD